MTARTPTRRHGASSPRRPERPAPDGETLALGEVRQAGGKRVAAWAIESEFEAKQIKSNTFTMEWPRGSGEMAEFAEIDRAEWFDCATARRKLVKGQVAFLDRLESAVGDLGDTRTHPGQA